jgi:hypothetical protein
MSEARTLIGTNVESEKIIATIGFKDLNKATWQLKLDYAFELANTSLYANMPLATLKLENTYYSQCNATGQKKYKLNNLLYTRTEGIEQIEQDTRVAEAKILEAKQLALLNGEAIGDIIEIEQKATNMRNDLYNKSVNASTMINSTYAQLYTQLDNGC